MLNASQMGPASVIAQLVGQAETSGQQVNMMQAHQILTNTMMNHNAFEAIPIGSSSSSTCSKEDEKLLEVALQQL